MREHCYCNMLHPRKGSMLDPEHATQVRDGIPLCSNICAEAYDTAQERREKALNGTRAAA